MSAEKEREANGHAESLVDDIDLDETDYKCGLGRCYLPCFDKFANAAGFTGFFVLPVLASQSLTSYVTSQVPSLEKQFALSSYESGIIMTFNDFGFLFVGLIVSVIPKLVHVPRWLFGAIVIFAISGLLCSLPHFIIQSTNGDQLQLSATTDMKNITSQPNFPICSQDPQNETDKGTKPRFAGIDISPSLKSLSIGLIGIGMGLQGAAKSVRMPFLTQYLDSENKKKTGFFLGILTSAAIFGPVVSYTLGGVFSRLYVTLEDVDMSTKDPRWIGAWWLGFLVFGILALLVSFPVVLFPRKLKEKAEAKDPEENKPALQDLNSVLNHKKNSYEDLTKMEIFKERALSYIRVIRSPVYMSLLVFFVLHISSVLGPIAFKSKYIEAQFGIPLWKANLIISGSLTATVATGSFFSGYITKKFKFSPRKMMLIVLMLHVGQIIFHGGLIFLGCPQPNIVGPNSMEHHGHHGQDMACDCDPKDFFPVCGSNKINYHSPCYAGCTEVIRNGRFYRNCTLIPEGEATAGLCDFDCGTLIPYVALNILGAACGSLKIMPLFIATIRSVEDRDKSTAAGLKAVAASLLAYIPAPIVFGKVIDMACAVWKTEGSRQGSCAQYNLDDLRTGMFGTVLIYKGTAAFFLLFVIWKVWKIQDWKELTKKK